jgi:hypothetical protein
VTVSSDITYVANFQPETGINDNTQSAINVYSYTNQIVVCNAEGESIEIFDVLGKRVAFDAENSQAIRRFSLSTTGIYLVRIGDSYFKKVFVRL